MMTASDDLLGLGVALFTLGAAGKIFGSFFKNTKDTLFSSKPGNWFK